MPSPAASKRSSPRRRPTSWQRVGGQSDFDTFYPLPLGPHWIAFEKPLSTRALRLRITGPPKLLNPNLKGKDFDGRRVWLGEVMALAPLDQGTSLASLVLPKSRQPAAADPRPLHASQGGRRHAGDRGPGAQAGAESGQRDPFSGRRKRRLVGWQRRSAARSRVGPARPLSHSRPGPSRRATTKSAGLWHEPLSLRYEFSIYNAGKPAWETADGTGCWLTTHTPPTSAAVLPGSRTRDGQPLGFPRCLRGRRGTRPAMAARRRHQNRRTTLDRRRLDRRADHCGRHRRARRGRSSLLRRLGLGGGTAADGQNNQVCRSADPEASVRRRVQSATHANRRRSSLRR